MYACDILSLEACSSAMTSLHEAHLRSRLLVILVSLSVIPLYNLATQNTGWLASQGPFVCNLSFERRFLKLINGNTGDRILYSNQWLEQWTACLLERSSWRYNCDLQREVPTRRIILYTLLMRPETPEVSVLTSHLPQSSKLTNRTTPFISLKQVCNRLRSASAGGWSFQ